jgi:hypothetical protein
LYVPHVDSNPKLLKSQFGNSHLNVHISHLKTAPDVLLKKDFHTHQFGGGIHSKEVSFHGQHSKSPIKTTNGQPQDSLPSAPKHGTEQSAQRFCLLRDHQSNKPKESRVLLRNDAFIDAGAREDSYSDDGKPNFRWYPQSLVNRRDLLGAYARVEAGRKHFKTRRAISAPDLAENLRKAITTMPTLKKVTEGLAAAELSSQQEQVRMVRAYPSLMTSSEAFVCTVIVPWCRLIFMWIGSKSCDIETCVSSLHSEQTSPRVNI